MLEDREQRNKLRQVMAKAEQNNVVTKEEAGFVITLVNRFRADIDKKIKQLHMLEGQISQLKTNEQIIINLIENMIAAAERAQARQDTIDKIRGTDLEETEAADLDEGDQIEEES
jgi:hypothetical protein